MDREPTDIKFGYGLVIAIALWIIIEAVGISNGDFSRSYAPLDADHHFCGYDSGYENYKYLYFTNISGTVKDMYKSAVCVEKCPEYNSDGEDMECKALKDLPCPKKWYRSSEIFLTCVPHETAFKIGTPGYKAMQLMTKEHKKAGQVSEAFE